MGGTLRSLYISGLDQFHKKCPAHAEDSSLKIQMSYLKVESTYTQIKSVEGTQNVSLKWSIFDL